MTNKIILAGNPNVGKSTLFNSLTGLRQHTGNWTGKTVGSACGYYEKKDLKKIIIDTPGTYSLLPSSPDEEAARDTICKEECDLIILVGDACCLERSLYLALQIMERRNNVLLCVNLMDEARNKGININFRMLSDELGIPVIGMSATEKQSIKKLTNYIANIYSESKKLIYVPRSALELKKRAAEIADKCVYQTKATNIHIIDKLLTNKLLALPIMMLLLFIILWLSISGANYPSELLSRIFQAIGDLLKAFTDFIKLPDFISSALIDGVYNTTSWVISVMLPPMAIFFPLFTLLEDFGLLPRIAFNMDGIFKKCGSCGKQALTMCMGLGCNAVGVTGCRIISSPREKIISILTNSFIPCNGRFPTIIMLASLLYAGSGKAFATATVLCLIVLGAVLTLVSSKILALSICKGERSTFSLELPPYRKPKILDTLVRSLSDRTAHVLLRAIKTAAPAGFVIWLLANIKPGDQSILLHLKEILDIPAAAFGLDGAIMLGFILGLPANEIVMPIIMLCYMAGTSLSVLPSVSEMAVILPQMGWNSKTIVCLMIFMLLHWPCATTLLTIKKECGKLRYVILAAAIPSLWGLTICLLINNIM